jgi:glycosyltransferase involved in cell wall biosynthesis
LRARLLAEGYRAVSVIGRGVDAAAFSPARRDTALRREWGVGPKDTVALSVGRVAAEKNIEQAIHAFRAMRTYADTTRMVVVGDGPVRERLQKRHRDVIFTGALRGEALARHYASADVFLFPSLIETFGNVVLEAMASGLAVVAYDCAAARDHLSAGDSAMLVPTGRAEEFTRSAVNLLASPETMARVRRNARKIAEGCDWESVVDALETTYRQVWRRAAKQAWISGQRPALGSTGSLVARPASARPL